MWTLGTRARANRHHLQLAQPRRAVHSSSPYFDSRDSADNTIGPATPTASTTASTPSEVSDFSEINLPAPSEPGPSNWPGAIHPDTYSETRNALLEREARQAQGVERLAVAARQRQVAQLARVAQMKSKGRPITQALEEETVPVFTLVDRLYEPIGTTGQVVRIRLHLPRVEFNDWE